ncbi:MAG: tRNA (adenosine(37)-N6)-dimethylallyltransferase MiaA [bacterium]|nr:tRNA (adenosine(37)-N6)-dimethylallyltransferase MiaA [bacterium]
MNKLLVIVGPTGTGKTSLALELAKKFDGELVSADSRQIFSGMDVGTGKVEFRMKNEELNSSQAQRLLSSKVRINERFEKHDGFWRVEGIPIHLYDVVDPDERFSVAQFQQLALEKIAEIISRKKLPILVGGTGLYVQAITEGLKIPKVAPDTALRESLEKKSTERLLGLLLEIDPASYKKIDQNNRRRITRALEVYQATGKPFSELREKYKVNFDLLILGLTATRERLYENTDQRVDEWFGSGAFQKEVEALLQDYPQDLPSFTSLGYQDVIGLLTSRLTLEEAIQRTKFKHHAYIRRQLTWFRKMGKINWFNIEALDKKEMKRLIQSWLTVSEETPTT